MLWIYTFLLRVGLKLSPLFARNLKAKKWLDARDQWKFDLKGFKKSKKIIWFHCASIGEFEQARPVIERLVVSDEYQIAITFFSPSGYSSKAKCAVRFGSYSKAITLASTFNFSLRKSI